MSVIKTKKWVIDTKEELSTNYSQIQEAANLLAKNEIVAFPTETVYGLGANALSNDAVDKIFVAKGRPSDNPLIVHISNQDQVHNLVKSVPDFAKKLMEAFWPGPLTLVLEKQSGIASKVTAGLSTVAIRMPDHAIALALIEAAKLPIAAPSANVSGKPSPTNASHVMEDLDGRIAAIVDGGTTGIGLESTVVDCTSLVPTILRPGGITKEQLEEVVGQVLVDPSLEGKNEAPKSPGVKYKHYAPKAKLVLVEGDLDFLKKLVLEAKITGKKVGILATIEEVDKLHGDVVLPCGSNKDLLSVAQELYRTLRAFDQHDLDIIYSVVFPEIGVGKAIMNRLTKAAAGNIIKG